MAHNKMPRNKNFEKRKDLEKEQKKKNEARLKNYHEVKVNALGFSKNWNEIKRGS